MSTELGSSDGAVQRPPLSALQVAGIVVRHLVPVVQVVFFGGSAGQFLLLSVFNISFSLAAIGTIGVAVSDRQRARRRAVDGRESWPRLLGAALLVTVLFTTLLGWWIVAAAADEGEPIWGLSLLASASVMLAATVPGFVRQYRADLASTLTEKERQARDRLDGGVLFLSGGLVYLMAGHNLTLTMIGATAVFIARDLRPDLFARAVRGAGR